MSANPEWGYSSQPIGLSFAAGVETTCPYLEDQSAETSFVSASKIQLPPGLSPAWQLACQIISSPHGSIIPSFSSYRWVTAQAALSTGSPWPRPASRRVPRSPGWLLDGFPAAQAGFSTGSPSHLLSHSLTFSHLASYPHYGRLYELFC